MLPPFDRCNAAHVVKYPLDGQLVCLSAAQGRPCPLFGEEWMRLSAPSLSQAGTEYPDAAVNPGVMTANKSTGDALSSSNSDHLS
jgi:hypothetical protein